MPKLLLGGTAGQEQILLRAVRQPCLHAQEPWPRTVAADDEHLYGLDYVPEREQNVQLCEHPRYIPLDEGERPVDGGILPLFEARPLSVVRRRRKLALHNTAHLKFTAVQRPVRADELLPREAQNHFGAGHN